MLAHARARAAAVARQKALPTFRWINLAAIAALALVIAACTPVPLAPLAGPDPADPRTRVPAVAYRSPVGPYVSRRPVEPLPWQDQNDRIAPAPKP
jgi:hypothetical protein